MEFEFYKIMPRHNKYVLIMIKHFSKWSKVVTLPDKFSEEVAYAFLEKVLSRFGALVEVLTDQGREFLKEFHVFCESAFVDYRTTSRDHPKDYLKLTIDYLKFIKSS